MGPGNLKSIPPMSQPGELPGVGGALWGWWVLADAWRRQDREGEAGLWQPKSGASFHSFQLDFHARTEEMSLHVVVCVGGLWLR